MKRGLPSASLGITKVRMEGVLGLGGFFLRVKDPKMLARWSSDPLGVHQTPPDNEYACWVQERGPTAFEP